MVWGAMSSAGVGPLCFLRSKVNTAVYQEVLEHFMLPAADQLYGDADRAVAITAISQYRAFESITAEECNNRSNRDISFFFFFFF